MVESTSSRSDSRSWFVPHGYPLTKSQWSVSVTASWVRQVGFAGAVDVMVPAEVER